jgi:hypothetical protein
VHQLSVSKTTLFETLFTLQGHYRVLLPQVKDFLTIAALNLFVGHDISFVYAFNTAYMQVHSTQRSTAVEIPILTVSRALLMLSQRSEAAINPHWLALTTY